MMMADGGGSSSELGGCSDCDDDIGMDGMDGWMDEWMDEWEVRWGQIR
jgi:hypothetical protein